MQSTCRATAAAAMVGSWLGASPPLAWSVVEAGGPSEDDDSSGGSGADALGVSAGSPHAILHKFIMILQGIIR